MKTQRLAVAVAAFGGLLATATGVPQTRPPDSGAISFAARQRISELKKNTQADPTSVAAHFNLGNALSDAGYWDAARAEFKLVLKLRPNDPSAIYNLGLTDLRAAQKVRDKSSVSYYQLLDSAHVLLLQAEQLDAGLPGLHQHLGYLNHQAGDQEGAIEEYRKAVEAEPNSAEALNNLGSAFADVENYQEALAQYKKAFTLNPQSTSVVMNLDGAVRRAGEAKVSLEEGEAALKQQPNSDANRLFHALAELWSGQKDSALNEFAIVLQKQPNLAAVHFFRGEILREKGRLKEAEAEYSRAETLAPERSEFAARRGATLADLGELEQGRAVLTQVIRDKPEDATLHFQLGRILQKLGQKAAAAEELKKSQLLNQQAHLQGQIAMNLLDGIRQLRAHNVPAAIVQFKIAQALAPERPEANFYLGIALSQGGDTENSTRAFERALRARPSNAEIHFNFGIALWQHQQQERAIAEFRTATQLRADYGIAHCALGLALRKTGSDSEAKAEIELSQKLNACQAMSETAAP